MDIDYNDLNRNSTNNIAKGTHTGGSQPVKHTVRKSR